MSWFRPKTVVCFWTISVKSNFGETKRDRSLIFVILEIQCRVRDAHEIFRPNYGPIPTFDNSKN